MRRRPSRDKSSVRVFRDRPISLRGAYLGFSAIPLQLASPSHLHRKNVTGSANHRLARVPQSKHETLERSNYCSRRVR